MALRKRIVSAGNQHADEYWKVGTVTIEDLYDQARIILVGYPSKEARLADKRRPNQQREFVIGGELYVQIASAQLTDTTLRAAIWNALYGYIKSAPRMVGGEMFPSEFADAVDDV